jgi:cytochrome P450
VGSIRKERFVTQSISSEAQMVIDAEGVFVPSADEVIDNPYPAYAQLRDLGPMVWSPVLKSWLLPTYRGVDAMLRDRRFLSGPPRPQSLLMLLKNDERRQLEPLCEALGHQMMFNDGADHTRLRNAFGRAFTPSVVEQLGSEIERLTEKLLDKVEREPRWDVIASLAYPLPVLVIGALTGVPPQDRDLLKRWSRDIANFFGQPMRTFDVALSAQTAALEMEQYFQPLIAERRRQPKNDLLGLLAKGDMSDREVFANAVLILYAGHETTANLMGNGLLALLETAGAWHACASGQVDWNRVVEELLRFDSPAQIATRVAGEDLRWEGQTIRAGQCVYGLLGSANRDGSVFPDPDRVDICRETVPRHLAFGQGAHFCLGAMLARLEGQIALRALARRFPGLRRDRSAPLRWRRLLTLRGLQELPVVS